MIHTVLVSINELRAENGIHPLSEEMQLTRSASLYAIELDSQNYLAHEDSEGKGPWERYSDSGGSALAAGEILGTKASGTPAEGIISAWMESPSHKTQILNPRWTCIGVGYACNEEREIFVVQFSNSLLRDYSLFERGESLILEIIPLKEDEELIFRTVMGGPAHYLRRDTLSFQRENLPLFLEIYRPGSSAANRIIYP